MGDIDATARNIVRKTRIDFMKWEDDAVEKFDQAVDDVAAELRTFATAIRAEPAAPCTAWRCPFKRHRK